jgi:hypothetical protein
MTKLLVLICPSPAGFEVPADILFGGGGFFTLVVPAAAAAGLG